MDHRLRATKRIPDVSRRERNSQVGDALRQYAYTDSIGVALLPTSNVTNANIDWVIVSRDGCTLV